MKFPTVKLVYYILAAIATIVLVIYLFTRQVALLCVGLVFALACIVFWMKYGKCPACKRQLHRQDKSVCPYCGEALK